MLIEGRDMPKVTQASHLQSWDSNQDSRSGLPALGYPVSCYKKVPKI